MTCHNPERQKFSPVGNAEYDDSWVNLDFGRAGAAMIRPSIPMAGRANDRVSVRKATLAISMKPVDSQNLNRHTTERRLYFCSHAIRRTGRHRRTPGTRQFLPGSGHRKSRWLF